MRYEKTAYRLREALDENNMSQQELADKSKIGKASVSHYINGSHEPGNKSALQMAKVLGVAPAWLMGFDVPKYPQKTVEEAAQELTEAEELYKRYQDAIPEIRAAVDSLLKPRSDS
jgi:transcriptional regulator with XRE-family HTH domain